jgi:hypothetical protein
VTKPKQEAKTSLQQKPAQALKKDEKPVSYSIETSTLEADEETVAPKPAAVEKKEEE